MNLCVARIVENALDGIRNLSAGVLANQLTAFISTVANSGWPAAVMAIDPQTVAPVIAVGTVLTFILGNKGSITTAQAEAISKELKSLAKTEASAEGILRRLAEHAPEERRRKQLSDFLDAVESKRFELLDSDLLTTIRERLDAASQQSSTILETLEEHDLTARVYFNQIDQDVQLLKSGQESLLDGQRTLAADVADLNKQIRSEGIAGVDVAASGVQFCSIAAPVTFAAPQLVAQLSERKSTVRETRKALGQTTWLALRGESGTGKSQLARLVVRDHDGPSPWLRFRDLDMREAALRFEASLRSLYATPGPAGSRESIDGLCTAIPDNTAIVLDDLPRFDAQDELGIRLVSLVQQLNGRNVRLVSTSPYPLAHNVTEILGNRVLFFDCPLFTVDEVAELLLAYGAPARLTQPKLLNVIHTLTQGHPILVVAASRFLKQTGWKFTGAELDGLLSGQYAKEIAGSTLDRLLATVTDEGTRDLLYRLKIISGEFTGEDVTGVASVNPPIDRSSERLHSVTGLWVQREADDRYSLSPLFRSVPHGNVDLATQSNVHLAVGTRIVKRRKLDLWDAARAIMHFHAGGAHNYAAWLLLRALEAILKEGDLGDATILLGIWGSSPMPTDVMLGLQVFVRTHQIEVRHRSGLSTTYLVEDLNRLVERLPEQQGWAFLSIVAVAIGTLSKLDPFLANRVCLRLIRSWRKWRAPDGKPVPPPKWREPEDVLWLTIDGLRTGEGLADWLDTVQKLNAQSRQRLFSSEEAEDGCMLLANRFWIPEAEKPEGDRDWVKVLARLDQLVSAARELGQRYLAACAVRAKVAILTEYGNDLPAAVELAEATLSEQPEDPRARFLVQECVARAYVYKREYEKAREWFVQAFAEGVASPKHALVFALANASRAFGAFNANQGLDYAEKAVRVADAMPEPNAKTRVQMLGELAVARWLGGDLPGAFAALDRAADDLTFSNDQDAYWKGFFVCFGHACGYLASIARTGQPPSPSNTGQTWTAPERGFFLRDYAAAAGLYEEEKSPAIFFHLVCFAEGVRSDSGADKWASRGLEAARQKNAPRLVSVFAGVSVAGYVARGDYERAVELGKEASRYTAAALYVSERGQERPLQAFDVSAVLAEGGDSLREASERHAAFSTMLLPAADLVRRATAGEGGVSERVRRLTHYIQDLAANSPCREYWESIAELFGRIFLHRERSDTLIKFANDQSDWLMQNLAYLGSTLSQEVPLERAVLAHVTVLSSAAKVLDVVLGAERRIVVPFVSEYWRRAFERERFRFSAPASVDWSLQEILTAPVDQRTKSTLKAIVRGLGVRVPDFAQPWLFGADSSD